jgi:hypothetical protein
MLLCDPFGVSRRLGDGNGGVHGPGARRFHWPGNLDATGELGFRGHHQNDKGGGQNDGFALGHGLELVAS